MKLLLFCPTAPRLESEVVNALFNQKGIQAFDVLFTRDNPYPYEEKQWTKNIQHNFEKMRRIVLDEGYDKVWCVESDTIPPLDALKKLLEVDAPVVGGLYPLRHGNPTPNVYRWAETLNGIGGCMPWSDIKEHWGETIQTSGVCTGCVVIDRKALEGFSFMLDVCQPPDGPFMEHCFHNGIKQMARLDVVCGHKQPSGKILWPQDFLN